MRGLSTSARLTLMTFLISLSTMLALGGSVYYAVLRQLDQDSRQFVRDDTRELIELHRTQSVDALLSIVRQRTGDPDDADMVYAVYDASGRLLAGRPLPLQHRVRTGWHTLTLADQGSSQRAIVQVNRLNPDLYLVSGMQTRAEDGFLQVMARNAGIATAVAALLSLWIGWLVSNWVSRRLERIDNVIARVGQGELTARVIADGTGDAFDRMGIHINGTLDQVAESMHRVRDITDHIAHDLRTPLTRLRNRLHQAQSADAVDRTALMADALDETDQLLGTFGSMLRLSRIENEGPLVDAETVAMEHIAADALELYEPLAQQRGLTLSLICQAGCTVLGDRNQLFQAVANVIDNAVKYSRSGTRITIRCAWTQSHVELIVEDAGPGIPADQRERVFDRFVRLENHRGSPGNGLGMPLVRAVIQRHGGDVVLADNAPGLIVKISLPRADAT